MSDPNDQGDDFATLLAEYEKHTPAKKGRGPRPGETVRARVVSIGQESVFVDLGGKAEGVLDLLDVRDADGKITVAVGDEIEARVVDGGGKTGCVVLRRVTGRGVTAKSGLEEAAALGLPVEGTVSGVNKGGVDVQVAGVRAFCPISQLDLHHVADAATFVGQKLNFRITKLEEGRGGNFNIVVSRRALLEEEQRGRAERTREKLAVGVVLPGTVTQLKDYGAFVDIGGIEGMLHISEIGFQRVAHPRDVLSIGQAIQVQVLKIEKGEDPRRGERISLSLKSLEPDPWGNAVERFPEGARLRGKVMRVESFGAFVEVAPGVEGLIHISELSGSRPVKHAREVVRPGAELEVTVIAVEGERRRISLGLAAAGGDADDIGAAPVAPRSLGTFGDLLAKARNK